MNTEAQNIGLSTRSLPIEQIEIIPLDIVPKRKRSISRGALNYGKSDSWVGRAVLVRVLSEGISGWGQIRPLHPFGGESATSMYQAIRDFYGPLLIGRDALQIESNLRSCERHLSTRGNAAALAVLDMAFHDLIGKAFNVPIHTLLGGACKDRIAMEWSLGLSDEKTMIEEAVSAVKTHGVKYVCVKVGPAEKIDFDVKVVNAISKAVGPDVFLGLDANSTYDVISALRLVERLSNVNLVYFEQPGPAHALRDMRLVFNTAKISVAADESLHTAADAANIVATGTADVLTLKLFKCGGLRRSREIAVIADAGGVRVNVAATANGDYIEAIANAHLCAAIPNHAFGAEFVMGLPSVTPDVLVKNKPIDVRDGYCGIPMGPGLGVDIDEVEVRRHQLARETIKQN